MQIVLLPLGKDGCSWYRHFQPYEEISRQGLAKVYAPSASDLQDERFLKVMKEADYLVGRLCHRGWKDWQDKYVPNGKFILDSDDFVFNPDPYGEIYRYYGLLEVKHNGDWLWKDGDDNFDLKRNREQHLTDRKVIERADLLTVSTPRLKEQYQHKNCKVVYNALDFDIWKPYDIKRDYNFRIGWSGGGTHYGDLYTVKEDLEYITNKYKHVKIVLSGSTFDSIFKDINPDQLELHPWIDVSGHPYRTILNNLDLAFIPLAKNNFNQFKSCIKWYEFAAIKVPCIAANHPPYSDEMPEIALTDNFKETIEDLIQAKAKRDKIAEYGYNWVHKNRDIKVIAKDLFESL